MKKQYELSDLVWQKKDDFEIAILLLDHGESAWNPICPTCRLWGPGKITYTRWSDGGIDALEEDR